MRYDKKIIVTGGAGFIGANYLNCAVSRYPRYFFINVDCLTKAGNLKNITISQHPNYKFEKIDIRNLKKLERVFEKHRPTGVIHFAAETHVDESIRNPRKFLETNVLGTENLLSLSRAHGVQRFHFISTDEVHGALQRNDPPWKENAPLHPNNPYSASKAAAEYVVRAYHKTYGLNTIITRSSNNYGPYQDRSKLIPKFITLLLSGKKVPLYARGEQVRDWIYVTDHVEAIDLVFRNGRIGETYDIGSGGGISNWTVTKELLTLTRRDKSFVKYVPDRPGHDFRYALDSSKIRKELGWEPSISLHEGLRKTFEFYKNQQ